MISTPKHQDTQEIETPSLHDDETFDEQYYDDIRQRKPKGKTVKKFRGPLAK